jgi:hypothetical protein
MKRDKEKSGRISIEDHRAWTARWTPQPAMRADAIIQTIAEAVKLTEKELVRGVIADLKYDVLEHARVIGWAREALTLAFLEADRVGRLGLYYTDGIFFGAVARHFSPTYIAALGRGLRGPREMKYSTIVVARQEMKALGLRLQAIRDVVLLATKRWYRIISTKNGRIVKPRKGVALDIAREEVGLPPLVRNPSWIYRADQEPPQAYLRIETEDEAVRSAIAGYEKMGVRIPPVGMDNYTLVNDATILGEQEYEPVRSGPRSRRIMQILSDTRLLLDVDAVRAERDRLAAALEVARQRIAKEIKDHGLITRVTFKTRSQKAGSCVKQIRVTVRDYPGGGRLKGKVGVLVPELGSLKTIELKQPAKESKRKTTRRPKKRWTVKWTPEEYKLVKDRRALEQKLHAMEVIADSLEGRSEVEIRTRMHQAINRRWHASSFWPEHVSGDHDPRDRVSEDVPEEVTHDGEVMVSAYTRVTQARGRLFSAYRDGEKNLYPREPLVGVDVSSSQWRILSVFLHDVELEKALKTQSMAEYVGPRVWPELDPKVAAARAKASIMQLGYAAKPGRVEYRNDLKPGEIQKFLGAISPQVLRLHEYARAVAYTVDKELGFRFIDPYDLSEVIWQPMRTRPESVDSDSLQIITDVPGKLDRVRLARQIPPMITHAMDSMFSGMAIERLHARGVVDIVALFDSWVVPERFLQQNKNLFEEVLAEAAIEWMQSLGLVYDALLQHDVTAAHDAWLVRRAQQSQMRQTPLPPPQFESGRELRDWMQQMKRAWAERAWKPESAPKFRVKPVLLDTWE